VSVTDAVTELAGGTTAACPAALAASAASASQRMPLERLLANGSTATCRDPSHENCPLYFRWASLS
jgi:hypothetical protein